MKKGESTPPYSESLGMWHPAPKSSQSLRPGHLPDITCWIRDGVFPGLRSNTLQRRGFPDLPGCLASRVQIVKLLLIFKGVHGSVETIVLIGHQLLFLN